MSITKTIEETSHLKLAVFAAVIGILATVIAMSGFDVDFTQLANKFINGGLVILAYMVYKIYYYSKGVNTDAKIIENPIAVAIDNGLFIIAFALAVH